MGQEGTCAASTLAASTRGFRSNVNAAEMIDELVGGIYASRSHE